LSISRHDGKIKEMRIRQLMHLRTNTRLLLVSGIIMLMSVAACAPAQDIPTDVSEVLRVDKEEVLGKQESGASILIADTRSEDEYRTGHIKGAVSAPLRAIETGEWQPPAGQKVVLYCS
jgi:hypothetical protein